MLLSLRLADVDVLVDRSWVATLLITTVLSGGAAVIVMPEEVGIPFGLAIGFAVAMGLTVSLLLHELAHARVSINSGIRVDYIRIHAAGALCRRRDPIEHARLQFSVAAAGPLASIALGVTTLAAAFFVEITGLSSAISAALWFVAFANVLIAASNMLPLLPFDGGKVLHAVMWRASGDRVQATDQLIRGGKQFARVVTWLGIIVAVLADEMMLGLGIAGFGVYLMFLPTGD